MRLQRGEGGRQIDARCGCGHADTVGAMSAFAQKTSTFAAISENRKCISGKVRGVER